MTEVADLTTTAMFLRLLIAAVVGGALGYERRMQHKSIGIAGMMLVAVGSASYVMLATRLTGSDPSAIGRAIQGLMQGIGFLGGAVIFKTGSTVRGIKTAATVWITGSIGLSIGTWFWLLGVTVGVFTFAILFITDLLPEREREGDEGDDGDGDAEHRPAPFGKQ